MKLSFIIITRDRPEELDDCLTSIDRQSIRPLEVIVIDGSGSIRMDGVLKKHDKLSFKYHYDPEWGTARARNYGICLSLGDVNVFVDDDVILHPSYAEELVAYFSENKDVYGITGPIYDRVGLLRYDRSAYEMSCLKNGDEPFYRAIRDDIEAGSGLKFEEFYRNYERREYTREMARAMKVLFFLDSLRAGKTTMSGFAGLLPALGMPYVTEGVHGCNMAFKREVFDEFLMDENLEKNLHYAIYEDHEFAYRVSRKYPIHMVPAVVLYHRKTSSSRVRYDDLFGAIVVNIHYMVTKDMGVANRIAFAWSVFGILCAAMALRMLRPCEESHDRLNGVIRGVKYILHSKTQGTG